MAAYVRIEELFDTSLHRGAGGGRTPSLSMCSGSEKVSGFRWLSEMCMLTSTDGNIRNTLFTECPKIYRKAVLHLLKYRSSVYFSRCSTDLR